ncbi:MAG TPA: glycosyltransferase family 39 protein [Pyrinomonadaceae bacterium]|nr:glycosyltransferase family 39 protein [Pyrinomonadaceae bacterium]
MVLLFVTVWGIGVSPDSTVYIGAARNLLHGHGLTALSGRSTELDPLTHYPPLYPLLLALCGATGSDPLHAARWLNAFILGINILLAGVAVGGYTRWSVRATALASLLVLAAPDMLQIHSMAWTEPLFILFSLAGLLLLAAYLEREQRSLLMASAVAVALGFLTRYVGVVLLATGVCGVLFLSGKNYRRRVIDAALFVLVACLPMGLWMMRNRYAARGATDREFVFHPVSSHQLGSALSTISTWLLLGKVRTSARATVFLMEIACLIVLCILLRRKKSARLANETRMKETLARLSKLPTLICIFIIFYAGFFIITASFIDFDTVFDERALAPVHVFGIVVLICVAHRLLRSSEAGRLLCLLSVILCLAFAGSYVARGANWVRQKRGDGQGYTSRAWAKSATIERIRGLPAGTPIFTNGYDAVYFLTGRAAMFLPEKTVHGTGRVNALYTSELAHMREQLLDQNGVLIYFDGFPERAYLPSEDELRRDLKLRLVSRETDGTIYQAER